MNEKKPNGFVPQSTEKPLVATTCQTCGRVVYEKDVDAKGNCVDHKGEEGTGKA